MKAISIFFKINNFPSFRSFSVQKIVAFVVFCVPVLVLLAGFGLIYVFVCSRFFRKTNRLEIALMTLFTILLRCTPINPPTKNYLSLILAQIVLTTLIYFYPCTLIFIYQNPFLFVKTYFHL